MVFNETTNYNFILLSKQGGTQLKILICKQKWKCFQNENKTFLKRKCLYLENICETKVKLF